MRLANKKYYRRLFLSTALTAVPLLFPEQAQADSIPITTATHIITVDGEMTNGIIDNRTYDFSGSFASGFIFQNRYGGITIGASDVNNPPVFLHQVYFKDASGYIPSLEEGSPRSWGDGNFGGNYVKNEFSGNISINNGLFKGTLSIEKGPIEEKSGEDDVLSKGNIDISGGRFFLTGGTIQTKVNNDGDILIRGGAQLYIGYTDVGEPVSDVTTTITNNHDGGGITISGGDFHISNGSKLVLSGNKATGTLSYPASGSHVSFDGDGTLQLGMQSFSINSPVAWSTGTLLQTAGTLNIGSDVTLKAYEMQGQSTSLVISGKLSIENNVQFSGNLSGSGELLLSDTANAQFGVLNNFGTISVKQGRVSFLIAGPASGLSLSVLNGATGAEDQIGIININSMQHIGTVNLGKAALVLNEELIVDNLNLQQGQVIFTSNDNKPLTLTNNTTIYNTAKIITSGAPFSLTYENGSGSPQPQSVTPKAGKLTIKGGKTLTFADVENPVSYFNSANLTVNVENNAGVLFNSNSVTFSKLAMTTGTAEVRKGAVTVQKVELGNNSSTAGTLTIDTGATMTVGTELTAWKGSTVTVNGTLNASGLHTYGAADLWATLTGSGTVNITGDSTFDGRIDNLQNLTVAEDKSATFQGKTGYSDTIKNMTVAGTVFLKNGSVTLDSLTLNNGTIELTNENVVLALKSAPPAAEGVGIISGIGTLELLGNTGMTLGGAGGNGSVGYLGGLKIGTGTVNINGDLPLGSFTFSSAQNGVLNIAAGTLTLRNKDDTSCSRSDSCRIITQAGNVVQGAGTLTLVNGSGSVFGGVVNLGTLNFGQTDFGSGNGAVAFSYNGTSTVQNFNVHNGATIVVNNGTLDVGNGFNNVSNPTQPVLTTVSGTGTLFLRGNASIKTAGSLTNLKIGAGTVTVAESSEFGKIAFASSAAGGLTVSANTTVTQSVEQGSGNTISGTGNLILNGATGTFAGGLSGLTGLTVQNGATAYINASTQVGNGAAGLSLINGTVSVASGATLTVKDNLDAGFVTGAGTLNLAKGAAGQTINASLSGLGALEVNGNSTEASTSLPSTIGNVTVGNGATLNFAGGTISGMATVQGNLNITTDTTVHTVRTADSGILDIDGNRQLTVTNGITVSNGQKLTGNGTLFLSGSAVGTFGMNQSDGFDNGKILIGSSGLANIQTNAPIGKIEFYDSTGGTLNIAEGCILSVGSITTSGNNKITGNGSLKLTADISEFKAPIAYLGTLNVTEGAAARFYNAINISALNDNGNVEITNGATMTVQNSAGTGAIYGSGSLIAGAGTVNLSTGGNTLAQAIAGTGTLTLKGTSNINRLSYSSENGTINVADGATAVLYSDFAATGNLTGAATASLQLIGNTGATFNKASGYKGSVIINSGKVNFVSATDLNSLSVVGSGSATFAQNSSVKSGSVSSGGTVDVGVNTLTVNGGNFTFADNSKFAMRLARTATDDVGNVNPSGYGKLVMSGGTLNIKNNVTLDMTIDYGLRTAETGSVFRLVEGNSEGNFKFSNNRYSLTKEDCEGGNGICYRLLQTSSAGQYAQQEAGDKNQVGIARAFLDGELFDTTSKAFSVAEHLDYLSQKGSSQAYLKALTALAPDVSNGMSRQQAAIQGKISNTLSARLNSLSGNMGLNSRTYQNIQKMYGRSGGSPYKSRFMRTSDYYKNAGYYEDEPKPVSKPKITQDRPHVDSSTSQEFDVPVEDRRWTKKKYKPSAPNEFGVWAQAFLNKADYSSTDKPEGFSGDTTGFAVGADVTLYDVFALGAGYASTSSTVDSLQRSTDIDGHSFFVYGMYKPSDWFVSSVLNMGWMSYTEDKNLSGLSISDKYDGTSFGGSLMVGRELKSWTPAVGIRYVSSKRDAHEDSIGQKIGAISSNMMTFVAEGRMDREFGKTDSSVWHSELSAAVTYDLSSSKESAAVNLPNGGSYSVNGDDFDPMGVELGGTLSWLYGKHIDISAGYNLEWRPDYLSHTLTATFRYSF